MYIETKKVCKKHAFLFFQKAVIKNHLLIVFEENNKDEFSRFALSKK